MVNQSVDGSDSQHVVIEDLISGTKRLMRRYDWTSCFIAMSIQFKEHLCFFADLLYISDVITTKLNSSALIYGVAYIGVNLNDPGIGN